MFSIAAAELKMLVRNRLVAVCAILIPLGFGIVFLVQGSAFGAARIAALQIMIMLAMGVYVTATTTLAARRQTLFLKRLRSGSVSDGSIIGGLIAPIAIIGFVQVTIVLTALSVSAGAPPVHIALLIVAILATEAMFVGFALATAGVTNSPEHAQVTTLPLFFVVLGVSIWITLTGTEDLAWLKRVLPGGGATQLIMTSWTGGDLSSIALLIVPTLTWAVVGAVAAKQMFHWEPRA
jgi:ABC-2 type transport system permease protein